MGILLGLAKSLKMRKSVLNGKTTRAYLALGAVMAIMPCAANSVYAADLSLKDAPIEEARKFGISVTGYITSDYVFRGISQTSEDPALQGSIDITYGQFYAGVWASTINYNGDGPKVYNNDNTEIDLYLGVRPVWGSINFDFMALYYVLPGLELVPPGDPKQDLNYVEFKAAASTTVLTDLTLGVNVWYSPDYFNFLGEETAVEGTLSKPLGKFLRSDWTVSGLLGYQMYDFKESGLSDYTYWNLGLTAAFHTNYSIDVRYHDTDLTAIKDLNCGKQSFQCDERVVGTFKVTY